MTEKEKVLAVVAAVGCLAAASTSFAALAAGTGVNGSLHDMTKLINNADVMDRVCVFCHTPHHASVGSESQPLPLWNRNFSTFADDQFEPYVWATPINAKVDGVDFAITDPLMAPVAFA